MLANYGYKDASGDFFITIDTDKCDGCGKCVEVCPSNIFLVLDEDPNDPLRDDPVVVVSNEKKKKLKYECNPCKPGTEKHLHMACVKTCSLNAISHSW